MTRSSLSRHRLAAAIIAAGAIALPAAAQAPVAQAPATQTPATQAPSAGVYATYTPSMCLRASERSAFYGTFARMDSVLHGYGSDGAAAAQVLRTCMAGRSVESTREEELVNLGRAYVSLNQDTLAYQAIMRRLGVATSDSERASVLLETVRWYSDPPTGDTARALAYAARLDALRDSSTNLYRARAYRALAEYAYYTRHDMHLTERAARAALRASAKMSYQERRWFIETPLVATYFLANSLAASGDVPGGVAVIDSTARQYSYAPPIRLSILQGAKNDLLHPPKPEVAAPLVVQQWIGAPPGVDTGTVPIPRGKATILLFIPPFGAGPVLTPALETLVRSAPADSVVLWMVATTTGYWHWQPNIAPAEEARNIAAYYHDRYHLTAPIAVATPRITKRSDGRLLVARSANEVAYHLSSDRLPWIVIVSREGTIVTSTPWYALNLPALVTSLRQALQ